jgi:hypothetical protein
MTFILHYRSGQTNRKTMSHTYAEMLDGDLHPMCHHAPDRYSILLDPPGTEGECKACLRNVARSPIDCEDPGMAAHPHCRLIKSTSRLRCRE